LNNSASFDFLRDRQIVKNVIYFYVSHSMLIIPCFSSDLNSGSPVRRGQLLIIAKAAAKESAYEIVCLALRPAAARRSSSSMRSISFIGKALILEEGELTPPRA